MPSPTQTLESCPAKRASSEKSHYLALFYYKVGSNTGYIPRISKSFKVGFARMFLCDSLELTFELKFINKKRAIFIGIVLAILSSVGIFYYLSLVKESTQSFEKVSFSSEVSGIDLNNEQQADEKFLSLLPKEVLLHKVEKNGFNQDKSLYSVNAYISLDTEPRLKEAGLLGKNSGTNYTGCWVINLRNNTVYRIATAAGQDSNFYQWVGNNEIELVGDGKLTATLYNAISGDIVSTRKFNLDVSADVSHWAIYRSEKYGFEVRYPKGLTIKENEESFVDNMTNRYLSFYDPDTQATIYLGLKQKSEKGISPRPFRTGIPGGEFLNRGTVAFGGGLAREVWLTNCYFPGENHCSIEFVWFCNISGDFEGGRCDNIDLGDKEVFMEVDLTEKSDVYEVYELMHGIIRTFRDL